MEYLTAEELLLIHFEAIREFGGSFEVLDLEKLQSCLESPRQTMFGKDLYSSLVSKAAILFYLLIKNHPFMDGNKRTAVLALSECLKRNGCNLSVDDDEFYQFTIAVATSGLDKEQVGEWIQTHLHEIRSSES